MTKVELHFDLARPLDNALMEAIARAHGIYGIFRVRLSPSMDAVTVEYDASRLTPAQVEAALLGAGVAIARRV